jgi:hypothetical protein
MYFGAPSSCCRDLQELRRKEKEEKKRRKKDTKQDETVQKST